jgi:hypothetical protein
VRERGDLVLQGRELGLHGGQRLWQRQEGGRQRWWGTGRRRGGLRVMRGQRGQRALVQAGEQAQVVLAQALFAGIRWMGLQGQVGQGQPAAQGFGIDA